jgi:hypothetical protein
MGMGSPARPVSGQRRGRLRKSIAGESGERCSGEGGERGGGKREEPGAAALAASGLRLRRRVRGCGGCAGAPGAAGAVGAAGAELRGQPGSHGGGTVG